MAEVATNPATSTDGYYFFENVKAFDVLEDAQTNWVYNFQLDPGTYYARPRVLADLHAGDCGCSASASASSTPDTIPLGARTLRVVAIRDDDADQPPALIVDDAELDAA